MISIDKTNMSKNKAAIALYSNIVDMFASTSKTQWSFFGEFTGHFAVYVWGTLDGTAGVFRCL